MTTQSTTCDAIGKVWPLMRLLGYSPAESEFLALVGLTGGYFLPRQFRPNGGKCVHELCRSVKTFRDASVVSWLSPAVYRMGSRRFWSAFGDPTSKPSTSEASVVSKLLALDYVLARKTSNFLFNADDRVSHFCGKLGIPENLIPRKFKFPVEVCEDGKVRLLYFSSEVPEQNAGNRDQGSGSKRRTFSAWMDLWRPAIEQIRSVEIVFISRSDARFETARGDFALRFPLASGAFTQDLLEWFESRDERERVGLGGRDVQDLARYRMLDRAHAGERFRAQYGAWLDRFNRGIAGAAFETVLMEHRYPVCK